MNQFLRSTIKVLDINIDIVTLAELIKRVKNFAVSSNRHRVMYVNVHVLNTTYNDPELRRILNRADLVYCDGAGVQLGARLLGHHLPERMTGADWIHNLCQICQQEGFSLYFLGGEPQIADKAANLLLARYPGLNIVGTHHGHYDHCGAENQAVVTKINALGPDILLVGFGTPLQEKWIDHNFELLNVKVVWAVGAVVDFIADKKPRAPHWMLNHSLEWLYRFWSEPKRLWKRYMLGNPLFLLRILKSRFIK